MLRCRKDIDGSIRHATNDPGAVCPLLSRTASVVCTNAFICSRDSFFSHTPHVFRRCFSVLLLASLLLLLLEVVRDTSLSVHRLVLAVWSLKSTRDHFPLLLLYSSTSDGADGHGRPSDGAAAGVPRERRWHALRVQYIL